MDTNIFLQLLRKLCIYKSNREDTKALNEQHTKEMNAFKDEVKEALNNNTIALTRLCERLDREEARNNEIK